MIDIDALIKYANETIVGLKKEGKPTLETRQRLNVLKLIKAEFLKKQTEPNRKSKELTEDEQLKTLMKMVSQRKESYKLYMKGGREDLAANEEIEIHFINEYLPKEVSDEEIVNYTKTAIGMYKAAKEEGYVISMRDMKDIMSIVKEKYPTANGSVVSKTLKEMTQ